MREGTGRPVFSGVAIGRAYVYRHQQAELPGSCGDAAAEQKKKDFKEAGIEYTIKQIDEYRACGIDGIHLYALNKFDDVARIVRESGIIDLI